MSEVAKPPSESAGEGVDNWCPGVVRSSRSHDHRRRTRANRPGRAWITGVWVSCGRLGHTTTVHVRERIGPGGRGYTPMPGGRRSSRPRCARRTRSRESVATVVPGCRDPSQSPTRSPTHGIDPRRHGLPLCEERISPLTTVGTSRVVRVSHGQSHGRRPHSSTTHSLICSWIASASFGTGSGSPPAL